MTCNHYESPKTCDSSRAHSEFWFNVFVIVVVLFGPLVKVLILALLPLLAWGAWIADRCTGGERPWQDFLSACCITAVWAAVALPIGWAVRTYLLA